MKGIHAFRKRPVTVRAVLWDGSNINDVLALAQGASLPDDGVHVGAGIGHTPALGLLDIPTLEGVMQAQPGDWIIRGVEDELYPCKPSIFEASYEHMAEECPPDDAERIEGAVGWAEDLDQVWHRMSTGWWSKGNGPADPVAQCDEKADQLHAAMSERNAARKRVRTLEALLDRAVATIGTDEVADLFVGTEDEHSYDAFMSEAQDALNLCPESGDSGHQS
jgi:hypothetical protein